MTTEHNSNPHKEIKRTSKGNYKCINIYFLLLIDSKDNYINNNYKTVLLSLLHIIM